MLDEEGDKELLQTIEEDNKTIKEDLKSLILDNILEADYHVVTEYDDDDYDDYYE